MDQSLKDLLKPGIWRNAMSAKRFTPSGGVMQPTLTRCGLRKRSLGERAPRRLSSSSIMSRVEGEPRIV